MSVGPTYPHISQQNVGRVSVILPKHGGLESDTLEDWSEGGGLDRDREVNLRRLKLLNLK